MRCDPNASQVASASVHASQAQEQEIRAEAAVEAAQAWRETEVSGESARTCAVTVQLVQVAMYNFWLYECILERFRYIVIVVFTSASGTF